MKEGQTFQKAGDEAKAAENYTKVVNLTTKSFKTQGLASLASLYFNNGAKILQAATPIANSDKAKYDAEKAKAVNDFKKAKDYLVQAQSGKSGCKRSDETGKRSSEIKNFNTNKSGSSFSGTVFFWELRDGPFVRFLDYSYLNHSNVRIMGRN